MPPFDWGTADLNNGSVSPEWRPLEEKWPLIQDMRMTRNGTLEDLIIVLTRAIQYYQQNILQRAPKTWVPILAGYPTEKVYTATQATATVNGLKPEYGTLTRIDDYYFLNPFVNMVSYTLKYQAPKGMKKAFGSEKIRRPDKMATYPVSGTPGLYYDVASQPMDNLIQFDCWSSTTRGADNLASWFKYFMECMKGSIMNQGYGHIAFWERGIDKDIAAWRDDISVRSLQYYIETQEFYIVPRTLITSINFELAIKEGMNWTQDQFVRHVIEDQPYPPSGCYESSGIVPLVSGLPPEGLVNLTEINC